LLARKDYVLERMRKLNYISQEQEKETKEKEIDFTLKINPIEAPHFIMTYVKPYLENKYGRDFLNRAGLKIYTTIDYDLQKKAEVFVEEGVKNSEKYNAHNGALVSIDPKTGEILAMVGSKNWHGESEECFPETNKCKFDPKVNVALSSRQPGSAFKPFVYARAFQKGYTPKTLIWDLVAEFNPNCSPEGNQTHDKYGLECYHPKNYDNKFIGLIDMRTALAQSRNLPSVKVLYLAGLK
ncbi:unnamed protein product, partial [marine sediment metagenome]